MDLNQARHDCATSPSLAEEDGRSWTDRKATAQALRAATARNSSGRRRFVDPTTCDREYTLAMQDYKQSSGRMFPTWSEVLEVLHDLGYEKPEQYATCSNATAEVA